MLNRIITFLSNLFGVNQELDLEKWQANWSAFLGNTVHFYDGLNEADKEIFHHRVLLFLSTTKIESGYFEVTDEDRLLVAASAIIPVWKFEGWHYFNLQGVYLLPATFNERFECGRPDSLISGMVGTGAMAGKMALSKPELYLGFQNSRDKQNVGIHEFVHLIDMADGECDGYPERLKEHAYAIHWFELAEAKITEIHARKSNIRHYGATNRAEFFAVATEYFFERPAMLESKHPKLYRALSEFYQQDVISLSRELKPMKNALCSCGSGKKYKRCCLPRE